MLKKLLVFIVCLISSSIIAGETPKNNTLNNLKSASKKKSSVTIYLNNEIDKKIQLGEYTIALTRIDDRMNRIHIKSTPRNKSLTVEAFDRSGNKMKAKRVGKNLSTASTSNHKYMYKSMPEFIVIE